MRNSVLDRASPSVYPAKTPRRDAGPDARITTGRTLPEATFEARLRPAIHCSARQPRSRTSPSVTLSEGRRATASAWTSLVLLILLRSGLSGCTRRLLGWWELRSDADSAQGPMPLGANVLTRVVALVRSASRLVASAEPFVGCSPEFVVKEPFGGPRNDRVRDHMANVPLAREVEAEAAVVKRMR